ncbi:hybrid sensor histidine kinase/response regulator transcription factor [Spirosoma gilvum]
MIRLGLLILLVISELPGFAQLNSSTNLSPSTSSQVPIFNQFERLTIKDGLSDNSVNCIVQDREGFLWFGTNNGLNKYDGYTFTILQQDPASPDSSLHSNKLSTLYEDRSGRLWATTTSGPTTEGGGLHQIDKRTGKAIPIPIKVPSVLWKRTMGIFEDRQGILWIGSWGGLIRYAPQTGQYALYPSPEPNTSVICAFEDTQHRFWVGTLKGLYRFDRQSGRFTLVRFLAGEQPWVSTLVEDKEGNVWVGTNTYGLMQLKSGDRAVELVRYVASEPIHPRIFMNAIHQSKPGQLWLGTTEGLQYLDIRTHQVATYKANPALPSTLSNDQVQAVFQDRAGTLWLGTYQGINKQIRPSAKFTTIQLVPSTAEFPSVVNHVSALIQDRTGIIWFGSRNSTLHRYNPQTGEKAFIPIDPVTPTNPTLPYRLQGVYEDHSGQLWVSTNDYLLKLDRHTGRSVQYKPRIHGILSFAEDQSGALWLGGEDGMAQFNPKIGQFRYYFHNPKDTANVPIVMVSRKGDVWMAVRGKGMGRLNPKTGQFTPYYPVLPAAKGQLNDREVTSLFEDANGLIWVGTNEGGLNWLDPATGQFRSLTTQQGLPANHISAIINDQHGYLWISTSRGLCRLNEKTKTVHSYTTEDGLPHDVFLSKVSYGRNGDLLFGSLNGVVQVHTNQLYQEANFPIYITHFSVFDHKKPLLENRVQLRHDENFVSFEFVALNYPSSGKNQYAYQLIGVDKDWVENGYAHSANYTNLSPGTYTFQVRAANSDGIWSGHTASIQLIIQPPWWATGWAYGLYTLLAGLAVWGSVVVFTNRIKQRQELILNRREAEQLKELDELKSRFFTNITHEFRTPLSLILSPVEKLLKERRFDESSLMLVHRNAGQLLRLINQLLDLSKLDGNYMVISLKQGTITDFMEPIVAIFQRSAEQKGVSLLFTAEDLPRQDYLFDADKWEKIMTNLLANALKFTHTGGRITLTIRPEWTMNELAGVQIQLTDTGIGIAPEHLPHIFSRFYQVDTTSTRTYEGTGIGLALVHELVNLLGGTIKVESQLTIGTTFQLTLPVQSVSTRTDIPKISWAAPSLNPADTLHISESKPVVKLPAADLSAARLLIVEDNDELREFLVGELEGTYQVFQAGDGEVGWEITQAELPDIVLTDLMMPRMDGFTLTRLIKENADTDHIAVVVLTAKTAQPSRIEGLQQGADEYLAKPFSIDELHLRLNNLIARQQKLGDHYRQQFALPSIATTPPADGTNDPFLLRIYELLDRHMDDSSINVEWLADQLAMNRKTLYRKVQSLIQLAPADLIRQYRMRKAAELLKEGHNVAETADLVGFNTPSHFTLVFKEIYQQTPSEFIASHTKNT